MQKVKIGVCSSIALGNRRARPAEIFTDLGAVYKTPGRLSRRSEFTKCHASASHLGLSSPRLLYRGENLTPVRDLATVSCKRKMTARFSVKSVCRYTGTGSVCVMFGILSLTCILSA